MKAPEIFFVGGEPVPDSEFGTALAGVMYVEKYGPDVPSGQPPVVLVHGGAAQGTDWLVTPDGRPGWASLLVDAGHTVYVVDRPGHGRSPYHPSFGPRGPVLGDSFLRPIFTPPALGPDAHPTAYKHTQWPGGKEIGDPTYDQFLSSKEAIYLDAPAAQRREGAAIAELLRQVGPAIVIAHSAGGPPSWVAADLEPDNVLAFVALEVLGPVFSDEPGRELPWGLTAVPLTFDPPVSNPEELGVTPHPLPTPGPVPLLLPTAPVRLANIAEFPIAVVTAEASVFRLFDDHLVTFLTRLGCDADRVRLEDHGVHGNSHGFIQELNNTEALGVVTGWLAERGLTVPVRREAYPTAARVRLEDLVGKVAVVTGGASGIGKGIARVFTKHGATVVLADRPGEALTAAAAELGATAVAADVTDAASVQALADAVIERFGKVHVVVNNAGVGPIVSFDDLTLDDFRWVLDVNLWGVINGTKTFLPLIESHREGGYIVNTASLAGLTVVPGASAYSASKFGVVAFSEALAQELALKESPVGIAVITPALVDTNIVAASHQRPSVIAKDAAAEDVPLPPGRVIQPEEVGRLVVEALSDGEFYIITHPEFLPVTEARHAAIEQAHIRAAASNAPLPTMK
jgi:NAD(P)-dependent dehydrogenase (short-subunit alcohol dehydrogenase family)